jgi:lipopolysaccharide export LptBFGC system permease protein LptF
MQSVLKKAFFAAALAALAAPAFSQSTTPAPVVEQRKENQQDRIANGVQSGQLTAGETANLEKKESALNKEENRMEKRDDGNLTAADKARLTRQQNRLSNQIYRDKHNGRLQNRNPKTEVGQRQRNQQERIAQGVKSGQLTPSETAHLERRESAINKEVRNDRAANGGTLTPAERRQVNRQENRTSNAIHRKKHNARTQ